ncbi:DUF4097 family beta strand repeat-containing protein [Actinomadura rubrisoli]|uniref:DUF4097 domain-containing protein n=1 Tax=Actinomadura rubrisoli TaxID=2530368 RepID=A0A4V2YV57_9ACTN|nr:DUF4097 family beta strand repeat-containing protein [Actinomadura rubrisoli]TDD80157.1 hypothetical protein E1298_26315 [Actinomadura rubrisoli]
MRTLTGMAVLAVLAMALTGCGLSVGRHTENRSYDGPAGVTALKVKTDGGKVEIVASDSPGVKVREKRRWTNGHNKPDSRHTTEGSTLSLSSKCAHNAIGFNGCQISYHVQVPRSMAVEVDTGDGPITVSGLGGAARLKTGSGSINASDLSTASLSLRSGDGKLRVSGRAASADLRTSSGSITATGLTSDRLTARSGDGDIRLSGRAAAADLRTSTGTIHSDGLSTDRLTAHSGDGGIHLALTVPPSNVQATTNTGSVRLKLPHDQEGYALTLATDTGHERVDPAVHRESQSARHIKLSTGDGNITVTPA